MTEIETYQATSVEHRAPAIALTDPAPVAARRTVASLIETSSLGPELAEGLVGAVSEIVTNAALHGRPPVELRAWALDREITVTVTDQGDGPDDPDVGHQPADRPVGTGGLGLWMARQMVADLAMGHHDGGFTVRLIARAPDA